MRWLVIHPGPQFSVADMHTGWVEALRQLGEQVAVYNLDDRLLFYDSAFLMTGAEDRDGVPEFKKATTREGAIALAVNQVYSAAFQFWPDVILGVSAFFLQPDLLDRLRGRGMKVVLLHSESPYQDTEQLVRAAHADLNLLNDPANIGAYQQLGVPARYMPHAYRPVIHWPGPVPASWHGPLDPAWRTDFAFVGTGFPSRIGFFERMDFTGLDVTLAGAWQWLPEDSPLHAHVAHDVDQCVDNELTAAVYRGARAGINIYRREAEDEHKGEGWAIGPREVEMAACGLFFLRDSRPEGDELFPMLPTFATPEDASEQLHWWLAHDSEREQVAAKARLAIAGRTFENNARSLLKMLGRP